MNSLENFDVSFSGLKPGTYTFEYKIDDKFFENFGSHPDFERPIIGAQLTLDKRTTFMVLGFNAEGKVEALCDVSGLPFELPLKNDLSVVVKFGDNFADMDEEVVTIPHTEHKINVAQWIYETIMLGMPYKKVHPDIESGKLETEETKILKQLNPLNREEEPKETNDENSPWAALKKLKDNN